jgi:hypothetical protein
VKPWTYFFVADIEACICDNAWAVEERLLPGAIGNNRSGEPYAWLVPCWLAYLSKASPPLGVQAPQGFVTKQGSTLQVDMF